MHNKRLGKEKQNQEKRNRLLDNRQAFMNRAGFTPPHNSSINPLAFPPLSVTISLMGKKTKDQPAKGPVGKPSPLVDTRVIYCGDNLDQLARLPDRCVDLIYIDPPFNSNRNYEVFWGETKEKRAFEHRHASTQAYIDFRGLRKDVSCASCSATEAKL
jgi:hypothetical protein